MKNDATLPATTATGDARAAGVPQSPAVSAAASTGVGAASGAAAGAAIGAFAGPAGIVAGALIGAAAGAATGKALAEDHHDADHDRELDEQIGVTAGDIGAATPGQPPAARGVYSAGSAGVAPEGSDGESEDAGPIPQAD